MKIFLSILILVFNLQSWAKADGVIDFEIEGMSIGDSLLDFMSIKEIKKNLKEHINWLHTDKKFQRVEKYDGPFEIYEYVGAVIKPNDPQYKIYALSGMLDINDPKSCDNLQQEIVSSFKSIFKNAEIHNWNDSIRQDPSGKSMAVGVEFFMAKGSASVVCYNFTEESNIQSGLDVSISNKEFDDWLLSFN
tara:strand:+ start:9979 stop:10551 length:573 start_codon:yes stop_codon:yes gene_type:complete